MLTGSLVLYYEYVFTIKSEVIHSLATTCDCVSVVFFNVSHLPTFAESKALNESNDAI